MVITDHFTRYAQAFPTTNQTAKTTAKVFFEKFIVHYGFPSRIHSDQGANFESTLISELCQLAGVIKSRTTPYHAMGNGLCERFNQSLLKMLGTFEEEKKADWKSHVGPLIHAYNVTPHPSTGYSPYYLMLIPECMFNASSPYYIKDDRSKRSVPSTEGCTFNVCSLRFRKK